MPERPGACPDAVELADFHASQLAGQAAGHVAEHVEACAACRAELAELTLDRCFAGELRDLLPGGPPDPGSAPPGEPVPVPERDALVDLLRETAAGERYELLGELGKGGMGVVYEVHDRVLQRKLAMKVARPDGGRPSSAGSPTGRRLARFLEEVRITGKLDHPSIIPVHDLGIDGEGRAYFTMRKVRGRTLHDVLEEFERGEGDWTLQRLVVVLLRACDALAYAHSKRVVHRDLKPPNIMVGRFSVVYVMDWGVAKLVARDGDGSLDAVASSQLTETSLWTGRGEPRSVDSTAARLGTLDGEVLGTPAYMAPEQALGAMDRVDSRADVYSMGAILYRLLSGRTPYDDGDEHDTPHTRWQRLLEGPPAPLSEVAPKAPPELVAICEHAMARNPATRYADMAGLTADLRAWLEDRVVRVHRTGAVIEARKWVRRNRALASAGLLVLVGLAVLPALFVRHAVVEARSRDRLARGELTLKVLGLLEEEPAEALRKAIEVAEEEDTHLSRSTVLAALLPLAEDACLFDRCSESKSAWCREGSRRAWSPAGDLFVCRAPRREGEPVEIRLWNVKARCFDQRIFDGSQTEVCIFHPDGLRIASGGADGSLAIHDLETGESLDLQGEDGRAHTDVVSRLAFDPDGELLASASWDGSVRLWNAATGELAHSLEDHRGVVNSIEFDAIGERLLSASGPPTKGFESDDTARVWNVADGTCLYEFTEHEDAVTSARFHPTENLVLSTSYDGTAQLWDADNGDVRDVMRFEGVGWDGAFSTDGSTLAVAFDSGFRVRDIASGDEERFDEYQAHDGRAVTDVEFSPDGGRLLTTGNDGVGRVWELHPGRRPRLALRLRGLTGPTFGSWSPDGAAIATHSDNGTRLWFSGGNPMTDQVRPTKGVATRARFHPAGDRVLLTFEDSPAYEYVFAPGAGLQSRPSKLGDSPARDVATSAGGSWTLVAEVDGPLRFWRRDEGGTSRAAGSLELDAESLHPSPTRDLLGAILAGGGAAVVDCSGRPQETARFLRGETVQAIRFSEDGRRAALGTAGGRLLVVDLAAKGGVLLDEQLDSLSPSQTAVFDVGFYDGGRRLLSVGPEKGLKLWDVDAGRAVEQPGVAELPTVGGVFVIRDGRQLLGRAQWASFLFRSELATGSVTLLRSSPDRASHRGRITAWSLDREQQRLLTTSLDHAATVWDLEHDEPWLTFAGHDTPVLAGDLTRDGQWAVTADASGRVFIWPTDPLRWAKEALPVDTGSQPR